MNNPSRVLLPLFLTLPLAVAAYAQTTSAPASRPARTELDAPYIDGSFGFSVRPFAGATVLRQKRVLGVADVEIVQFVIPEDRWSLTVRLTTTTRPLDADTIVAGITDSLSSQYADVKPIRGEEARIASREGARYAASFAIDRTQWLRQQAVVRTKPAEYLALVMVTPLGDATAATPLFDRIVDSLQILRSEVSERQLRDALERGTRLLQGVARGGPKLTERLVPESYLRFFLEGKEIGFVQVTERSRQKGTHEAIEIRELAWLFKPDGSTTHLRHRMELTNDLSSEEWENRVVTIMPTETGKPPQILLQLDSGLRQDDKLIVAYTPEPNSPDLLDRLIDLESSYASAAWHSLLPRVVDLHKPETYAFSSYNADRRGLVLRALQVVGPTRINVDGSSVQAIKLEDSEGMIPPANEIDVDAKGRIIRVIAGPLEMFAATREDIDRRYSDRVKEGQATLKKYPLREPKPAPRQRSARPPAP